MALTTFSLRWADVAPKKRCFDELRATELVSQFMREADPRELEQHGYYHLERCLDQLLVTEFGAWISGWKSGEDGGPVLTTWELDQPGVHQTLAVMQQIAEWRSFLEAIDRLIKNFPLSSERALEKSVQKAAVRIIPLVLQKTGAMDAWYRTCALALSWYLEAFGVGDRLSRRVIADTFSGQFASCVRPSVEQQNEAVRKVSEAVAATPPLVGEDCLARWLEVREAPAGQFAHYPAEYPPLRADGHLRYIREREKDERMLEALGVARRWARGDQPLTVSVLKLWLSVALAAPKVALRTTDAFAKKGRERYGVTHLHLLHEKLSEANLKGLAAPWRAAMVYLDICFFHPFPDGNARLARLAADAILLREGFALNYVEPVFVVARAAEDAQGGTLLSLAISDLMGRLDR